MSIITISREYGSGGDEVALRVCKKLGYHHFDKRLLARVATDIGLLAEDLIDFSVDDYKVRTFLDRLLVGWRSPHAIAETDTWSDVLAEADPEALARLDQEQYIRLVELAMQVAMEQDDFVMVGRGGQAFFKDIPGVLHVRIIARFEDRVRRVQQREKLEEAAAQDQVNLRDRASAEYLSRVYEIDWANPLHYHLVLNTSLLSIESAAQIIVNAASNLRP